MKFFSFTQSVFNATSRKFKGPFLNKRFCSSSSGAAEAEEVPFWKQVCKLYVVLVGANFISNAMIHPTDKIDYGMLNKLYPDGREVNSPFWGTRLPHLFAVPATLTFFDFGVSAIARKYCGLVSFAATPAAFLVNLYVYTWLAVGSFIAFDAALNPAHEGRREEHLKAHIKPLTIGMSLQWHAQIMLDTFGSTAPGLIAMARNAFAVACIFFPVKSLGFGDFGKAGLSAHERKMNNISDPIDVVAAVVEAEQDAN